MAKMVTCKTCGKQIAKTAKVCPHCGAKQHQVVLSICVLIVVVTVFACIFILKSLFSGDALSMAEQPKDSGGQVDTQEKIVFEGKNATATYKGCFEATGVTGCFYINLMVKNTGDVEQVYLLTDVYVDDVACYTGTGLPVVADVGKKADGSFIVFCKSALADIEKVEFKVSVMDNNTYKEIESSNLIEVKLKQ